MKKLLQLLGATAMVVSSFNPVHAQAFTEGFEDITTLTSQGWYMQNNSTTVGSTTWFQGNTTVFPAQSGSATSYIGANFNSTTGNSTISTWLVTPNRTFKNGDTFSFYTRCSYDNMYADRLEVRMSTNGTSTNVGTGPNAVGDFTTELLTINPNLQLSVYPYVDWAQYTITISGLSQPTSGRIAFRYHVTSGGPQGTHSDFIGIDNVVYTPFVCPGITLTNTGTLTDGEAGTNYVATLAQTGAFGTYSFELTDGALPNGLVLGTNGVILGTPTETGTFEFEATISDAGDCTETGTYSITIDCSTVNPITFFSTTSDLCSSNSGHTLTEGLPAGGTYSGANVTDGVLALTAGTHEVYYTYTNSYGCEYLDTTEIIVSETPTVSFPAINTACIYHEAMTLSTASPAGGMYSGNGVSNGSFIPSEAGVGSHTITYTYTENGCTATAETTIMVDECLNVDNVNGTSLSIYPNPAHGTITIQLNDNASEEANVKFIAADGKVVKSLQHTGLGNGQQIDISDLAPGIYTIQVEKKSAKYTERLQIH